MIYEEIILGVGLVTGLVYYRQLNPNFLKGIFLALVVSFILLKLSQPFLSSISTISLIMLTLMFTIYSGVKKKWLSFIIGLFAFIRLFFGFMHFEGANELKLLMIIPIITFLVVFIKQKDYKKELAILSMLVAYELTNFLQMMELWFW